MVLTIGCVTKDTASFQILFQFIDISFFVLFKVKFLLILTLKQNRKGAVGLSLFLLIYFKSVD